MSDNAVDHDSILARIRKLLALASDNPSKSEATAAALAAQRLMAQHNVSESELAQDESEEIVEIYSSLYDRDTWRQWLAKVIADNFRCRCYGHGQGTPRHREYSNVFVGYATDAEAARITYEHLASMGSDLYREAMREYRRKHGNVRGFKNSYLAGYVKGIRTELERQTQALLLVRPKAVNDYYENRTRNFRKARRIRVEWNRQANEQGESSGREAVRSSRMDGQLAIESA